MVSKYMSEVMAWLFRHCSFSLSSFLGHPNQNIWILHSILAGCFLLYSPRTYQGRECTCLQCLLHAGPNLMHVTHSSLLIEKQLGGGVLLMRGHKNHPPIPLSSHPTNVHCTCTIGSIGYHAKEQGKHQGVMSNRHRSQEANKPMVETWTSK